MPFTFDLLDENSIAQAAASLKTDSPIRLIIVATGLLHDDRDLQPEKNYRAQSPDAYARAFAINATGPIETNAHLLKYDSVHGRFGGTVKVEGNTMDLGRGPIRVMSTYNPEELDWDGIDVVLECTGKFNEREKAAVHLGRGAKRVLVSAPAKRADMTVVWR